MLAIFITLTVVLLLQQNPSNNNIVSKTPQNYTFKTHTIILEAEGFKPNVLEIERGDVVTWINKSGKDASVNSANHPNHALFPELNLGLFKDGQSLQAQIFGSGELKYLNHLEPTQSGKLNVKK